MGLRSHCLDIDTTDKQWKPLLYDQKEALEKIVNIIFFEEGMHMDYYENAQELSNASVDEITLIDEFAEKIDFESKFLDILY